jgi:hypothetical protein
LAGIYAGILYIFGKLADFVQGTAYSLAIKSLLQLLYIDVGKTFNAIEELISLQDLILSGQ